MKITDRYGNELTPSELMESFKTRDTQRVVDTTQPIVGNPETFLEHVEERINRRVAKLLEQGKIQFQHRRIVRQQLINSYYFGS